ncbi:MAG: DUF1330 domain-containing protein [Alphaproteobacteria bacterium HGW-Alphaproteobacteria-11]|nr:MAG: DUF1330 domain-containing protein [Alphaproteobacteria bacterium HGW-Alphaproteobacteria-11]
MKTSTLNDREQVAALVAAYGDGADGAAPRAAQWQALLARPPAAPVTFVNFFKLRAAAKYPAQSGIQACSGQEAFGRYAAVSAPGLEKVGGRFLLLAPFEAALVGEVEDWDFVAVGAYPDKSAVLALFEDADYRQAWIHRVAACERQKVLLCAA